MVRERLAGKSELTVFSSEKENEVDFSVFCLFIFFTVISVT